jgi:predicted CxxxxCH...CXXCH cytochrome family protein
MRHDATGDGRLARAVRAGRRLLGALVAFHALTAGVPALVSSAGAQISPGPLSSAHSSLDSPLNCTKCHGGGKESMTARCTACHREITWLAERNRGFHARAGRADCASCHPDHAGRTFALVKWPDGSAQRFDHTRTGWALEDKHARVACEKCHTDKLRTSPAATLVPAGSTPKWTGLETNCVSCHEDVHKATLGKSCESCHTAAGWSPAPKFDHARSQYPLTGKHADVACEKCHTADRRTGDAKLAVAQFKPLAHGDCVSCHRDPHAGRLRGACSSCHVTTSFSTVEGRSFWHDRTRYPLRGRHASVSCAACHTGYPSRVDQPQFATCAGCHADPHKGQATIRGAAVDCAACHTVSGYTPSTFTVAQHAQTAYPLEGRHAWVSCAACHSRAAAGRGAREIVMRPAAARCESCHADAHGGQLAGRSGGESCATCHTPSGWKPSTFGVREHASLRVPLTGRHAAIDCASCHSSSRRGLPAFPATRSLGSAKVALHLDETTCQSCHRDPHGGRYTAAGSPGQSSCAGCHDTRAFHPSTIGAEAHARFSFALEGAHRAAPCTACHTTMKSGSLGASLKLSSAPATAVRYTIPGATCASCHGTPHGTQFADRPDGGTCESCHDLNEWSPASRFVHEADGGFVLGAAHARVPCAKCHVASAEAPSSGAARKWHGVSRSCESCHRSGAPGS